MKTKLFTLLTCLVGVAATSVTSAQFVPNDEVELLRDEPLIFNTSVYRQGRKGERFRVATYRADSRKIFLLATDAKGKTFALNVPDAAVGPVAKDVGMLNEQAFAALRAGRLDEAQKLMLQVAMLDRERDVCAAIATHVGRILEAKQNYQLGLKQYEQAQAEVQRRLKNAAVTDRTSALFRDDNSGQIRAEQMRREAQAVAERAKAAIESKLDLVSSELRLLDELAAKREAAGACGEALDINAMVKAFDLREFQGTTQIAPIGRSGRTSIARSSSRSMTATPVSGDIQSRAAEATKSLEDARRYMMGKKLYAAQKSVSSGLAAEPGSYSLQRLNGELAVRMDAAGKAYATAVAHQQLKHYEEALKALEQAHSECADHEPSETLAATLKTTVSEKGSRMAKAKVAEDAGKYAEALEAYETYAQDGDIRRIIPFYAKQREGDGDFLFAYNLYEKAGLASEMQRVQAMKEQQLVDYSKARVLLVDAKFADALAIYRRYKDARMEKDAIMQQGSFLESQGKFDEAMAVYRDAQIVTEVVRVKEFVSNRESFITQGKQQERAASYDKAIELFQKANAREDVGRVASAAAREYEKKQDYQSAAEYYEIAGMFDEAGRIRREHDATVAGRLLDDTQIFKRCGPACVTVLNGEGGSGSGFFVKKGGYILTNHHVVYHASRVRVVLASNQTLDAIVIQSSKVPDLALLKVELKEHAVIQLGDSDRVEAGAHASTIGSPKGQPQSFTAGNISNTDRNYRGNKCFQISVLINHGNSGGALFDQKGQAIGICSFGEGTAVVLDNGTSIGSDTQGINYAIKINEAKRVFKDTLAF